MSDNRRRTSLNKGEEHYESDTRPTESPIIVPPVEKEDENDTNNKVSLQGKSILWLWRSNVVFLSIGREAQAEVRAQRALFLGVS